MSPTLVNLEPAPASRPTLAPGAASTPARSPARTAPPPRLLRRRPADAYTAVVTATLEAGRSWRPAPTRPRPLPAAVGVAQPYLDRLAYRRTDHDGPALKRSASASSLAKPRPGGPSEANGPVYPWRSLRECQEAPVTASHFRRSCGGGRTVPEYNVVPSARAR